MKSTTSQRSLGVNLVGYHHVTSGLGEAVREMDRCFTAAGIDLRRVDVTATNSPQRRSPWGIPSSLHPTTVAVVTAADLPYVWNDLAEMHAATRRLVGVFFWELSTIPDSHAQALEIVDEIWAPTTFIRDAYIRQGRTVHQVPLRVSRPASSDRAVSRWRAHLNLASDDFMFLSSCDLFSLIHRKNPLGVIDAFVRAFRTEPAREVRLVVKVLNGERLPRDLEMIQRAAAADPRISIIDEHLSTEEHQALIELADCFVSLHRSEGLGLQLATAMWQGTVVLATRYGGNVDFMDDTSAALVDYDLVPVGNGRGAYPDDAVWAEPNLDDAAQWMRRLVEHPELRHRIAANAKARMEEQPSEDAIGRIYDDLLRSSPALIRGSTSATTPDSPLSTIDRMSDGRLLDLDVRAYRQSYADLGSLDDAGLRDHYREFGVQEGRCPTALFDPRFYAEQTGIPFEDACDDYRGRHRLKADPHPLFDVAFYRRQVGEVFDPVRHYTEEGWREGLDPHPLFSTTYYVGQAQERIAPGRDPLTDFILKGWALGLDPHPLFSTDYYLALAPDIAGTGMNPLSHFWRFGGLELRAHHPLFDPEWYVQRTGCTDIPVIHYLETAGRHDPSPIFNTRWYLKHNEAGRRSNLPPLVHWVVEGAPRGVSISSLPLDEVLLDMVARGRVSAAAALLRQRRGSVTRPFGETLVLPFRVGDSEGSALEGWVMGGIPGVITPGGTLIGTLPVERPHVIKQSGSVVLLRPTDGIASAVSVPGIIEDATLVADTIDRDAWSWYAHCLPALLAATDADPSRHVVLPVSLDDRTWAMTRFALAHVEVTVIEAGTARRMRNTTVVPRVAPAPRSPQSVGPGHGLLLIIDPDDPFDDAARAALISSVTEAGGLTIDTTWGPAAVSDCVERCNRLVAAAALPICSFLALPGSTIVSLDDDLPAHAMQYITDRGLLLEIVGLPVDKLSTNQHDRSLLDPTAQLDDIVGKRA